MRRTFLTLRPAKHTPSQRLRPLSTTPQRHTPPPRNNTWQASPAPPRLPKDQQEIFEQLQRQSTGAFSTPHAQDPLPPRPQPGTVAPVVDAEVGEGLRQRQVDRASEELLARRPRPQANQSPHAQSSPAAQRADEGLGRGSGATLGGAEKVAASVDASVDDRNPLHPDVRRGAKPEFEGDVNPVTGEVGGPKNEPLRWGGAGDWSYNGRVTDF